MWENRGCVWVVFKSIIYFYGILNESHLRFMRFAILFIFLQLYQSDFLNAQKYEPLIQINILDKRTGEGINNVSVFIKSENDSTLAKTSHGKGRVEVLLRENESYTLSFIHPLYNTLNATRKIGFIEHNDDTLKWTFEMLPLSSRTLNEVVIRPPGVPDTVFQSEEISVADFEMLPNGKMVLLTYPKQLKKGSDLKLYDGQQILSSFSIPDVAEELVRDFRGNAHVICKENVFCVSMLSDTLNLSTLPRDYFFNYVAPIVDTSTTKLFFSNFNELYPAFDYFAFDQLDSVYKRIAEIEDELMMELYRSEYKWVDVRTKLWAKYKELETGIDAEIWVGANYFTQSLYYKELYAPMFGKNDTFYVFDYYKDRLLSFDKNGDPIDSVAIYHHYNPKYTGWAKQLLQDRQTGMIYALFQKDGFTYLGLMDLNTGEVSEKVKLAYKYVDKVLVFNNSVYYIYRPFESAQKKFLYKERLPYQFEKAKIPQGKESLMDTGK